MSLPPISIPFNKPFIAGKELYYIAQSVAFGHMAGDGHYSQACCRLMQERFGIHRVMLTPSCTASLEMGAMLAKLGPGDEAILPAYTFVSTANAIVRLGCTPVFVDIRPDTLNIDERLIEAAITPRTRAIFPVHYAGVACHMDTIMALARRHDLIVVEDAAQGVHSYFNGKALGSIGQIGCYSFHETKNYISGEGGAICLNDPALVERAEIIRDKGTNRRQFFRGLVDKYTWVDVGSSYVPSEIVSAFLFAQLEMLESIAERRKRIYQFYRQALRPLETEGLLRLPSIPEDCQSNYHMFYILLPTSAQRDGLLNALRERGIQAVFHYVPLHTAPMGRALGGQSGHLPVTEDLSARLLRLPFYYEITEAEQTRVVEVIEAFVRPSSAPGPSARAAGHHYAT